MAAGTPLARARNGDNLTPGSLELRTLHLLCALSWLWSAIAARVRARQQISPAWNGERVRTKLRNRGTRKRWQITDEAGTHSFFVAAERTIADAGGTFAQLQGAANGTPQNVNSTGLWGKWQELCFRS